MTKENVNFPLAYGVRTKNKDILLSSSSGGIFSEIANYAFEKGIIVYGCILTDDMKVKHCRAETKEDIVKMRTSKYVQSDLTGIIKKIKKDIKEDKKVLFTSAPCYVNTIMSLLSPEEKEKVITMDFICHGMPKKKVFEDHIQHIEQIYKSKVIHYSFRNKRFGWTHDEFAILEKGKKKVSSIKEIHCYKRLFHLNYSLNYGCFFCKYTTKYRKTDFTIGDFWGVEETLGILDNKGMSALLVNTPRALKLFENIENIQSYPVKVEDFQHGPLRSPAKKPEDYLKFWEDYSKYGYEYASNHYAPVNFKVYFSTYRRRIIHLLKLDYFLFWLKYKFKEKKKNGKK